MLHLFLNNVKDIKSSQAMHHIFNNDLN